MPSGYYYVVLEDDKRVKVFCDMETSGRELSKAEFESPLVKVFSLLSVSIVGVRGPNTLTMSTQVFCFLIVIVMPVT